jgi:hypothetical protein
MIVICLIGPPPSTRSQSSTPIGDEVRQRSSLLVGINRERAAPCAAALSSAEINTSGWPRR